MSEKNDRFGAGGVVSAGVLALLCLYFLAPAVVFLPLKLLYGRPSSWPPSVVENASAACWPIEYATASVLRYAGFVHWQMKAFGYYDRGMP